MTTVLDARDVSFGYGDAPTLEGISLSLRKAEVVALLGPNGSGKSTLLKVLLGIHRCRSGDVRLEGQSLRALAPADIAKRMAYVPQSHHLSFSYSVLDVVLMGRMMYRSFWSSYSREDRRCAENALDRLRIAHLTHRPYTEISGGERQLALIARALAQGAEIVIMDEPVSGLDYGNQVRLLEQIALLASDGLTFLKTTHFPDHALLVADRVVLLKQGRVVGDGHPQQVVTEDNVRRLYEIDVDIVSVRDGYRCCVPRLHRNGTKRAGGRAVEQE
ncbi:MAG: ABC transporter domain-containing protein [Nitrospira sp.]|nr:MAG: ABC transporter domain-containing protein [Nitrospira sp.]